MLFARNDLRDAARAGELLAAAENTARSLGMFGLADQATALMAQI